MGRRKIQARTKTEAKGIMQAGRAITKRMDRERITNADVARKIGVTPQAVAFWRKRLADGIPLPIGRLADLEYAVGMQPPPLSELGLSPDAKPEAKAE